MSDDSDSNLASRRVSNLRTTLVWCAVLVLAGIAGVVLVFTTEPVAERESAVRQSASLVDVIRGQHGTFRPTVSATGTVRPAREISLSARVEGEIVELGENFVPGGFVDAGELLVHIDDADYRVVLEQQQSALEQAIAGLEIEQGERAAAASDYRQFDRELPPERRALVLREPQGRSAQASVDSARADVRQAGLNLERTTVEAPFDAHVLGRAVNLGSQVSAGTELGRLVGLDTYWVEATVPVSRLEWLEVPDDGAGGSRVTISVRSSGGTREGRVFRLIGELEGSTRLARILVTVDDPLARETDDPAVPRLMLGEYVECRIEGREIPDVVRVSRDYIRADDTVWLMVDGRLAIRPVDIVFRDDRHAYVREGLTADDAIVTTRLATVEEGLRLRLDDGTDSAEDAGT